MKSKIALIVSALLVAGSAVAADNGFYVGAGMGYSNWNVNDGKIDGAVNSTIVSNDVYPYEVGKSTTTQTATPWEAYVGYRFHEYFAAELGWISNGGSNYKGYLVDPTAVDPTAHVGTIKGTRTGSGWPVSLLGIYPIDKTWEVFARAGVYFGSTDTKARAVEPDGDVVAQIHDNGNSSTNFIGGLGVDAKFMDNWTARGEWFAIPSFGDSKYGSGNLNAFMFSINYRF